MTFVLFIFQTFIISLSGVMAPGPLTAVTVSQGNKSPHAGTFIAFGHGIVEIPLIVLIFLGFGKFIEYPYLKQGISFLGGILLLLMAIGIFRNLNRTEETTNKSYPNHSIFAGMLLSISNPYFLIWWATVGMTLIIRANNFGITGFMIFALVHWSCDLVWLYFLSFLSFNGSKFFGKTFQKIIFIICGVFLAFFGSKFIFDGINSLIMN